MDCYWNELVLWCITMWATCCRRLHVELICESCCRHLEWIGIVFHHNVVHMLPPCTHNWPVRVAAVTWNALVSYVITMWSTCCHRLHAELICEKQPSDSTRTFLHAFNGPFNEPVPQTLVTAAP